MTGKMFMQMLKGFLPLQMILQTLTTTKRMESRVLNFYVARVLSLTHEILFSSLYDCSEEEEQEQRSLKMPVIDIRSLSNGEHQNSEISRWVLVCNIEVRLPNLVMCIHSFIFHGPLSFRFLSVSPVCVSLSSNPSGDQNYPFVPCLPLNMIPSFDRF